MLLPYIVICTVRLRRGYRLTSQYAPFCRVLQR